jgi:lipopolysaccharide assembly outer membrane protein LptD (OstA)
MKRFTVILYAATLMLAASFVRAQEGQRPMAPRKSPPSLEVRASKSVVDCRGGKCVETYVGDVELRVGEYLINADNVILYRAQGRLAAEGNVVFAKGAHLRTGSRLVWDIETGQVVSFDATGFKRRKKKPQVSEGDARLAEAIRKAYEEPGEALRRDKEAFDQRQRESTPPERP